MEVNSKESQTPFQNKGDSHIMTIKYQLRNIEKQKLDRPAGAITMNQHFSDYAKKKLPFQVEYRLKPQIDSQIDMVTTSRCLTRTKFIKAKGKNYPWHQIDSVEWSFFTYTNCSGEKEGMRSGVETDCQGAKLLDRPNRLLPAIPSDYFLSPTFSPLWLNFRWFYPIG